MTKTDQRLIWEAYVDSFEDSELQMGIEVEMEHTDDPKIAEQIARDHLAENPTYYTDLKRCEDQTGKKL
jgi:hypothetical protein